ncbi:MAG TPA: peptidylprolyl isomerase [Patescibacteria group bacterium]|nr:peptidylprolyl isomerase [Patescibacteria group bacterium]
MKQKIKKILAKRPYRKVEPEKSLQEAIENLPRITNETVAEHREEVLGSARKYIYPLQHSLHRIVVVSTSIFIVLAIAFFAYCLAALYKFNSTSTFVYRVTQVVPFPIAKAGPYWVAYENYLFELRHYMHYYQTQQAVDFNSDAGKQQLKVFKKIALNSVVDQAYIKQLAQENHISVTDKELEDEITLLRNQNRLGSSNQVFADVLNQFWGWSLDDFKRELKSQMLTQKVVSKLDTKTHTRAQNVLTQLNNGGDFATLAKQNSDDLSTKDNGGDYGFAIDKNNRDLSPQVIDALFKLQPGQYSGILESSQGLEIVKVREKDGDTVRASHIFFQFNSADQYVNPLKSKEKTRIFN